MTYFPEEKHLTCGMPVVRKKVVLRSVGSDVVYVYLNVRSGGFDAIVRGASIGSEVKGRVPLVFTTPLESGSPLVQAAGPG